MAEMYCPNCGHHLVRYRTERQSAGEQEVVLQWMICPDCRHVGLKSWAFADGILPDGHVKHAMVHAETMFASSRPRE